jgi:thymidylate synthase
MISVRLNNSSLGRVWVDLLDHIVREGTPMGDEGLELLGRTVSFPLTSHPDDVLDRFADQKMMQEMQKVFFTDGPNALGHTYTKLICGPGGRNDLQDVIELLRKEPLTKRALVNFSTVPGGKVPCVTALQFLIREDALQLIYFARGQDIFRKFYADALCLGRMGETVASALTKPVGLVRGFIGSSHFYERDLPLIQQTIAAVHQYTAAQLAEGALA